MIRFYSILFGLIWFLFSGAGVASDSIESQRLILHNQQIFVPNDAEPPDYNFSLVAPKFTEFDDFKISETVSPATFDQRYSDAVVLTNGKFAVVWQDDRDGYYKIFGQAYDSNGTAVGNNIELAGRSDGYNSIEPKAVSNGTGGFYLGWRDQASGMIYLAGYDSNLNQTLEPFIVNDIPTGNYAGPFDLDSYGPQYVAVAYEDHSLTTDISLRIFSSAGIPLTAPIKINTDAGSAEHWSPSIVFNHLGGMAVVWEDYRNGNADIFFQLVNANGSLSGGNLGIIEAMYDDSAQYLPQLAYSTRDGYAIAWLDNRGGVQNVYMQRYIPASGLSGGNIKISGTDPDYADWNIGLDVNSTGDLNMVWSSSNSEGNILLQRFTTGFALAGVRDTISCCQPLIQKTEPIITIGISGKLISSWTDHRNGHRDIYLQYLNSSGASLLADDKLVNDDSEGAHSIDPHLAILSTSMNAIIFMDKRNDEGDIYLQLISSGGTLSGGNILLNTDNSSVPQSEPSLAVSDTAILTVWNDTRSVIGMTGQRIFGKYLDYNGVSISGEFVISDSSNINIKSQPQVTLLPNNTALVVWQEITGGMPMVLGRFLNPDGTFLSSIFTISNDANDIGNDDINLSVSPGNIFVIGWIARDAAGGPMAVVARYNASGAFINRFTYTSPIGGVDISDIAIAIDNSEHIYLLWEGSDSRLYFSRCSSTGLIDINGSMIEDVSSADFEPAITVDSDGNMILCYIRTSANIRRLYYQVFNTSLNAFLKSYASPLVVPFMGSPSIAVANHDLYFVWVDPREDGMNIYSASITYTPSAMDDDKNIVIPDNFSLEQNFPNPFNPSTTIRFNLPHLSKVNLSIYNLLGEKVMTLIDREMTAGVHSISWNGEDENGIKIGSGIYFYRLNSGQYEQSRKMILLK